MLLSFTASNFRAFAEEIHLDLTRPSLRTNVPREGVSWVDSTVRVAGIFGPNASGKSTVLDAIDVLARSLRTDRWLLHAPSKASGGDERPTAYRVQFVAEKVRYEYEVTAMPWGIAREVLSSFPRGSRRLLFMRRQEDQGSPVLVERGASLTGPTAEVGRITTPRALFLATAHRYGHDVLAPIARALMRGAGVESISFRDRQDENVLHRVVTEMLADPGLQTEMASALAHAADLGLESIEIAEAELPEGVRERARRLLEALDDGADIGPDDLPTVAKKLVFTHRGSEGRTFTLGLAAQSAGTVTWLTTIWHALHALRRGTVLLIDELDASLHPTLSRYIVELFVTPHFNENGAQLIFTSHDATLLGNSPTKLLAPAEVWFVEKNSEGTAELFPLASFDSRRGSNNEKRYLAGAFGAVPVIDDRLILQHMARGIEAGERVG